jgi:hypothetical protein
VYYSQSGPIGDGVNEPAPYLPSRELGTAWLIEPFRGVGLGVEGVRIAWLTLAVALIVAAFREIGRFGPPWSGQIGAFLFGTYWITGAYLGSFFGSLLGALAMVLATALYLRLQHEDEQRVPVAVLFGLAVAAGFYMRGVETAIVVAILVGHSAVWRRGRIWRRNISSLAIASAAFGLAFGVPWVVHSTYVYGGPVGHLTAWVARRSTEAAQEDFPVRLHNGLETWFDALTGRGEPGWARVVLAAALVALVAPLVAAPFGRYRLGGDERSHTGLIAVIAVASFGFFFFIVVEANSRYALYGAAFTAVVAGQLVGSALRRNSRPATVWARVALAGVAVVSVGWMAANGAVLHRYDDARDRRAARYRQAVEVLAEAARGRPCAVLFAGRVRPQITIAAPCRAEAVLSASGQSVRDLVSRRARQLDETAVEPYVVWLPERMSAPDPDWTLLRRMSPGARRSISVYAAARR